MMTKPIEIIHQNFEIKLASVKDILNILSTKDELKDEYVIFDAISQDYREQTLDLLCEYFEQIDTRTKCQIVDRYMQVVVSRDFITRLNDVVQSLKEYTMRTKYNNVDVQLLFKMYYNTPVDTDVQKLDYKSCPNCQGKMNVHPQHSELRCTKCPLSMLLKGTVFDEHALFTNDGNLSKRGAYETSRHCKYHLERILAIKNPNITDEVWAKIHAWLRRNNFKYLKLVTCPDYRRCLKEIKETRLNEHIPFIRQFISGVSPERLFHHEMRLLYIYFEKAVTAFNKIKEGERANLKYYPYFIFKIIEMILSRDEDKHRLQSIVDCIHFQRNDTIVANDRLWNEICDEVSDFVFKKTDKNLLHSV